MTVFREIMAIASNLQRKGIFRRAQCLDAIGSDKTDRMASGKPARGPDRIARLPRYDEWQLDQFIEIGRRTGVCVVWPGTLRTAVRLASVASELRGVLRFTEWNSGAFVLAVILSSAPR
jgi:hypothetical protein